MGDPRWHDPEMAGWWLWGSARIGPAGAAGGPVGGRRGRSDRAAQGRRGVSRQMPHLRRPTNGQGINNPSVREARGVSRQVPQISDDGRGVSHHSMREEVVGDYHPMTMPELRRWFAFLSARLRHVRVLNGDWTRAVTGGAVRNLGVRSGGFAGVFVDPPYGEDADRASVYTEEELQVARRSVNGRGDGPPAGRAIVLAGYDVEHRELFDHGWREVEWYRGGFSAAAWATWAAAASISSTASASGCPRLSLDVEERKGQSSLFGSPAAGVRAAHAAPGTVRR